MGASAKHGGTRGVVRAEKAAARAARVDGRDPRAVEARALIAEGVKLILVARKVGLSRSGLDHILERDLQHQADRERPPNPKPFAPRLAGDDDACHLVCFDIPARFGPPARAPGSHEAWARREVFADRVEAVAAAQCGAIKASYLHLADLHRHHATFYPIVRVPASDCSAPAVIRAVQERSVGGSPSQLCAEAFA